MIEEIISKVPDGFVGYWILMLILLLILAYKFWPDVKGWLEKYRKHENSKEDLTGTLERYDKALKEADDKFARDYRAINDIHNIVEKHNEFIADSLEEREIIMRSMLAVLKGLQELGTNGPTKSAQKDIEDYMNRQAHEMKSQQFRTGETVRL